MTRHLTRRVLGFALASLVMSLQAGVALGDTPAPSIPSNATPPPGSTLTARPSIIATSLRPGDTNVTTVSLTAGVDLDATISADGLGEATDGSFQTLASADDHSPYSARSWVSIEPATVHLAAGSSTSVTVTTHVPTV